VRVTRAFALFATVGLTLGGCQTLTEELPAKPSNPPVQIPVLPPIVPPANIPDVPTGGGGAPPPPPTSEPAPDPAAPPPPGGGGPPGQVPNNTSPVTKVGAKVYFLECGGQQVPDSEFATSAQVGCRIHFDCTPKDANNNPTQSQGYPEWVFSPGSLVDVGNVNDFTPTAGAKSAGELSVYVVIDGVTSNTINISLYN
jgi:hypothetical protein